MKKPQTSLTKAAISPFLIYEADLGKFIQLLLNLNLAQENTGNIQVDFARSHYHNPETNEYEEGYKLLLNADNPNAILDKRAFHNFILNTLPKYCKIGKFEENKLFFQAIEIVNKFKAPQDSSLLFCFLYDKENPTTLECEFYLKKLQLLGFMNLDVSSVTNMSFMFFELEIANPQVRNWKVSQVTNMYSMFALTGRANPDVSKWDVSSVTNLGSMFKFAAQAQPKPDKWDVSSVTDFSYMFYGAQRANPDVSEWHLNSAINLEAMFCEASQANPNVTKWNLSKVLNISLMFGLAKRARPDIRYWQLNPNLKAETPFEGCSGNVVKLNRTLREKLCII